MAGHGRKNHESKNPSLGEDFRGHVGKPSWGAIPITQAGAFCKNSPLNRAMKKLRKVITSILPSLMLLVIIGAGGAFAYFREQQLSQPQQEIISPTPSPKNTPKPTPSPSSVGTKPVIQKSASNRITCTGPDGKQFQTTRKECDDFNAAWGNPTSTSQGVCHDPDGNVIAIEKCPWLLGNQGQAQNGLTENQVKNMIITEQAKQGLSEMEMQNKSANYNACLSDTFSKKNTCQSGCSNTRSSESNACSAAYLGSNPLIEYSPQKYDECIAESSAKHESCYTNCSQQYDATKCQY